MLHGRNVTERESGYETTLSWLEIERRQIVDVQPYRIPYSEKEHAGEAMILDTQKSLELCVSGTLTFACSGCDFSCSNSYALIHHSKIHETYVQPPFPAKALAWSFVLLHCCNNSRCLNDFFLFRKTSNGEGTVKKENSRRTLGCWIPRAVSIFWPRMFQWISDRLHGVQPAALAVFTVLRPSYHSGSFREVSS